ncbi:MAG: hypothetical protein Q9168_000780 [Polycauliona sp. 1 TL-2023]
MSDDTTSQSSANQENSGFVPGDNFTAIWINRFRLALGLMTYDGEDQWKKARDIRDEAKHCARCEKHRDYLLNYSPIIRFMRENINQLGGDLHSGNIRCRRCGPRQSGGFDASYGITLCANELRGQDHVEDTIAHGKLSADTGLGTAIVDGAQKWYTHMTISDSRASALSGECRWFQEFFNKGQHRITQQFQECIRRRAIASMTGRPGVKDDVQAAKVVNEVWDSCFPDTRPFDEIYR